MGCEVVQTVAATPSVTARRSHYTVRVSAEVWVSGGGAVAAGRGGVVLLAPATATAAADAAAAAGGPRLGRDVARQRGWP